jgi:hypothetical protein
MGSTVSDLVAAINARRIANRVVTERVSPALGERYESSIPNLAAQFGYVAWRS